MVVVLVYVWGCGAIMIASRPQRSRPNLTTFLCVGLSLPVGHASLTAMIRSAFQLCFGQDNATLTQRDALSFPQACITLTSDRAITSAARQSANYPRHTTAHISACLPAVSCALLRCMLSPPCHNRLMTWRRTGTRYDPIHSIRLAGYWPRARSSYALYKSFQSMMVTILTWHRIIAGREDPSAWSFAKCSLNPSNHLRL